MAKPCRDLTAILRCRGFPARVRLGSGAPRLRHAAATEAIRQAGGRTGWRPIARGTLLPALHGIPAARAATRRDAPGTGDEALERSDGAIAMLGFGPFSLDLRRQELRCGDTIVHVEPQVFDLLVHLIRHRDRVVSKDELLDAIWHGRIVSEAALSSRINAARKAIGDDGESQRLIRTVHKRGFRFVGDVTEMPDAEAAGEATPPPESAAQPTPHDAPPLRPARGGRPSIVVLPFASPGAEADAAYFSYGLTEDIVRMLARFRWLDVLSRHSGAPFRDREVDPREIGTALGVRYIVQGSVWRLGRRARITADLVCAETARQLWSEAFDFSLDDLLSVQRSMAEQIAATIEPELARLEREAAVRRPPRHFDAWDFYQRGLFHLWGFTVPGMEQAEAMFRRAIEVDPGFARAHGGLSYVHLQSAILRPAADRAALLEAALVEARIAVSLDAEDSMNLCVLGRAHTFLRDYPEAIARLEQAVRINPSFAQGWYALGFTFIFCGREEEAIACIERATDLSPRDPHLASFHAMRALAHFFLDDFDSAAELARQGARVPNAKFWPHAVLAAALGLLGRMEEAARAVAELLRLHPAYSIEAARGDFFFCPDHPCVERFIEGLRRAGVPDHSPAAG